jgi:hypothetical protein
MKKLIIAFLFLSLSTAVFAAKAPATKQTTAEAPAKKFTVLVNAMLNNQPEDVKIKIYKSSPRGAILAAEGDTSKGQPVKFKLLEKSVYRIEAFFPKVEDTAKKIVKDLKADTAVNLNLEYYNINVTSLYNNASDRSAAATIRIAARSNQARTIATGHTDSYAPATFFLPAHQSYVVGIKYDDSTITANPNGKVIYDLKSDASVVFNY